MAGHTVRLRSLELRNIKNVTHGIIRMPVAYRKQYDYSKSEILGLYGQNGSGKTAAVDAMYFVWKLLKGDSIINDLFDYIDTDSNTAEITAEFAIYYGEVIYDVDYQVVFKKTKEAGAYIAEESLSTSEITESEKTNKTVFMRYRHRNGITVDEPVFTPKNRYEECISANKDNEVNLLVAKIIAEQNGNSYIFGEKSRKILTADKEWKYSRIIRALHIFATTDLFVIRNSHSGMISSNWILPMSFRLDKEKNQRIKGDFPVLLKRPTVLNENNTAILHAIISDINSVLYTIIPGMTIMDNDLGKETMNDGNEGHRIELLSVREGRKPIPLRMESEGIIKIISILSALIKAFSDTSICIAIDELDAGIYEYLLGELLKVFAESAKGQLIFTSHNLRPLEMLDTDSIMFTTTNPANRYIRMHNVKSTNNLRRTYIRSITLGGQKEPLYNETDTLKMGRAFRKAGRRVRANETK